MVGDSSDDSAPVPTSTSPDVAAVAGTLGDGALDLGYTVTVDSFSGPLDLLLYLVRRTELDILEVPLSLIVDQFVDTVRSWQDADLDVAGEFILMAATLLEFKARTIAPPLDQPEEGAEDEPMFDPRESLLRSLLAYRRFKEAAQGLDALEAARRPLLERQVREHVPEAPPEEGDFDLGEIDLSLLATTCERILSRIGGLGPRTVMVDEMPLGVRIASMLDELAVRERATIRELLAGNHSRVVHITTVMATLELTRQRFIEVEQPEQFGDIALRLRSSEEREREPQLPPPEPEGPKRRRKLPLVTFTAPPSATAAVAASDDDTVDDEPEDLSETDEQRFLRELEEATRVTAVLAITANVEKSFTEHWYTLHPELKPVVAPPPPAPEPVVKRFPPRRTPPAATPADGVPAVPAAETPAVPEAAVAVATVDATPVVPETTAALLAEVVTGTPVIAEPPLVTRSDVDTVTLAGEPAAVTVPSVAALADPISAIPEPLTAVSPAALVESPTSEAPAATTTNEVPVPAEQHVLPVEQWPVMHAMPAPEEAPHPLDTIASDDPAAVNALLSGEAPRTSRNAEDDEEEEEELDPDELLADDPALVNAALQADTPRQVERKPVHEITIPTATETSVWTAPVDRGQMVADVDDDVVAPPTEAPAPVVTDIVEAGTGSPVSEPVPPAPVNAEPAPVDAVAPASVHLVAPTPTTAPLILPEAPAVAASTPPLTPVDDELEPDDQEVAEGVGANDPALVDAALQADTPRASIDLHPVHDLTIPTATETTVWTAPVDRGQTAAEVDDEPELTADIAADDVSDIAAPNVVEVVAAKAPVTLPVADVIAVATATSPASVPSINDPTPTTAPLVLSERAVDAVTTGAAVEIVTTPPAETPAALVDDQAVAEDPPPPEDDGPPVAAPPLPAAPPPPRSDSPLPAPITTPTPKRPMSPPPRSKAWLLIAIFIAINAGWAGVMWLMLLPRDVLEVAATELGSDIEHPTLTWRFNLDVVDAEAQAKPPELVPLIAPALPGRWSWTGPRTLVFEAAGPLPLATTFTATLPTEDFRTVQGFRLRAPGAQTWSTPALAISGAVVETFDRDSTTIALTFNQPVDPLAIAQELSAEIVAAETTAEAAEASAAVTPPVDPVIAVAPAPAETSAPVVSTDKPAAGDQQPAASSDRPVITAEPAVVGEPAVASTPPADPVIAAAPPAETSAPVVSTDKPAASDQQPAASSQHPALIAEPQPPVVKQPVVRAISTGTATTVRLLLAAPVRGSATLRLPAGTMGVSGPLGLDKTWEQRVPLQQTLHLTQGDVVVPSHGHVRVDVAVSDPAAPRELLAPVVTVEPAVPVTVSTTATGVSLVGPFVPGESYRIAIAATWPDEPSTSGHVLSAYTAASAVRIAIPPRPAGIWPLGDEVIDGLQRLAAHAVPRADVMLLTGSDDECVASREITWTSAGDAPALLDLDDLTQDQPAAEYRLRVTSGGDLPVTNDQTLMIENLHVRPQALFAAMTDWAIAAFAGNEDADVPVRVVRVVERR